MISSSDSLGKGAVNSVLFVTIKKHDLVNSLEKMCSSLLGSSAVIFFYHYNKPVFNLA